MPSFRLAVLAFIAFLSIGVRAHADDVNREQAVIIGTRLETGAALGAVLERQGPGAARVRGMPSDSSFKLAAVPNVELWAARLEKEPVVMAVCRGSGADAQLKAIATFAGENACAVFTRSPDRILFAHHSLPLARLGELGRTLHPGDAVAFLVVR